MNPQQFTSALTTPLTHVYDLDGKTILKTLPEGLLAMLRAKGPSEAAAQFNTQHEFFELNACLVNFALKPSPENMADIDVAIDTFKENITNIVGLLNSCSTHVLKAVNASLPGVMIIDQSEKLEHGFGICKDTLAVDSVYSMGSDAKHAAVLQFWTTYYTLPTGVCARNLDVFVGAHGTEFQTMLEKIISLLANGEDVSSLYDIRNKMVNDSIPQEVFGKEVLFPLSSVAAQDDGYLIITPVPSVATLKEMKDRYVANRVEFFEGKKAYADELKKFNSELKAYKKIKNKDGIDAPVMTLTEPVYPLPAMKLVKLVASNPQNLGGELMKMSGQPVAFNAYIQPLPFSKTTLGSQKLVQNLRTQYHSLLRVTPVFADLLFRECKTAKLRLRWTEELHYGLSKLIQDLVLLRRNGLPISAERVRLKEGTERRYILREMAGDKLGRSLNATDLSEISTHVVNTINYQLVKGKHALGMPPDTQEAVIKALNHLFRKVS